MDILTNSNKRVAWKYFSQVSLFYVYAVRFQKFKIGCTELMDGKDKFRENIVIKLIFFRHNVFTTLFRFE